MRSEQETIRAIEQYSDTIRRLCMLHLKQDMTMREIRDLIRRLSGDGEDDAASYKNWEVRHLHGGF